MTIQITVRLPDDLVAFVDAQVANGEVGSRAQAVARALACEQRRQVALRDVAILAAAPLDPDLDGLVAHTSAHPLELDD